jgi:lysophospholipase L1-like esterase
MKMNQAVVGLAALALFTASGIFAAEAKKDAKPADKVVAKPAEKAEAKVAAPKPKPNEPAQGTANGKKDDPQSWWRGNCERINRDLKKMEGKVDVGVIGDSITARWGGETWAKHWGAYRAVNMGIGGDQTQNVLWRLQNGQLDGYKARMYVLMIGTNNMWDKKADPAEVAEGVKAILDLIKAKQPEAKILLLGIFPTGEKPNPGREKRAAVNELISKFAGGPVSYMDIGNKFLDAEGNISKEYMHDFLHLGAKGYDIWAEAIKDKVAELLGETKPAQK